MRRHIRFAAITAALALAAGCGIGTGANTAAPAGKTYTAAKQVPAKAFAFKGISGDGRIGDHFTTWEYQTIRFKAVVEGADGPLTYKWDSFGQIWGKDDQPEIRWSGPWDGWYDVTCTVTDAAGNSRKKTVSVKVWRVPTPPPMPPVPPVPHP